MAKIDLRRLDAYWRAANYLSVGQIYLLANPLLREPLDKLHIKSRLVGHWGTSPGLNFIYAHLNRVIIERDLNMIHVCGPGHGGPAIVANTYLEGSYTEHFPHVAEDIGGLELLFRQFSFPGGISSHTGPETPGSIHEGGELGYSLMHAFGAAFDNPDLIVACTVGDGEAETGPLSGSWQSNKFLNPAVDGAVLPILHLNGYKIANPTILGRTPDTDIDAYFSGLGYNVYFIVGDDPMTMHEEMARKLDRAVADIYEIQHLSRASDSNTLPRWPIIVLRSPKGWTGPKLVDGKKTEDFWRSHQVPLSNPHDNLEHRTLLEEWLRSYRPQELFDESGRLVSDLRDLAPQGERRMGSNPHANGGILRRPLVLPDKAAHAARASCRGVDTSVSTRHLGSYLAELIVLNDGQKNFRLVGPDETSSNRLDDVFKVTERVWLQALKSYDVHLAREGRVMEILSEHLCQGWLEGYLLSGRHGLFSCYEAFIHIIDSMFNQHAKWLKVAREVPWRRPIASLNYLLTSHVWRQDHNGFSHQDPGFVEVVLNKKPEIVRVYLPPDGNTLLCIADHCFRTIDLVNVIIAGKQPALQWLSLPEAEEHCRHGIGAWSWAGVSGNDLADIVLACAGDIPTLETLAATVLLRELLPTLRIKVVNVVDLMTLHSPHHHPHALPDTDYNRLFPPGVPVIFAYHGYPYTIHRLTYKRANHEDIHVRGYIEEGTTTTPFDMVVLNGLDRFHLVMLAIDHLQMDSAQCLAIKEKMENTLSLHHDYIRVHGEDMPEVRNWTWTRQ
jgi:xylulose-5-phosphate/fructose-6-phosphate phosphoketolase